MLDYMYLMITCMEYWSSLSIEFLPTDEVIWANNFLAVLNGIIIDSFLRGLFVSAENILLD